MYTEAKSLKVQADKRTKCIIFGFCRNVDTLLHSIHDNDPFYNIPELVILLIISYFFIADYFDVPGINSILSEDKYSIIKDKHDGWSGTCYGSTLIPSTTRNTIYKWYLNMVSIPRRHIMIGIASKALPNKAVWETSKKDGYHYYYWSHDGTTSAVGALAGWKQYGSKFNTGDHICVVLEFDDGKNATISYCLNGENQGIAYHVHIAEDISYRLAISLCATKSKITMEKLEIIQK